MILPAPSARLSFLMAAVGLPLGLAAPFEPLVADTLPWALALIALAAAWDAAQGAPVLDGVKVKPGSVLRQARGRSGLLRLVLSKAEGSPALDLNAALALPPDVDSEAPEQTLALGSGAGPFAVNWALSASRRGVHKLGPLVLETASAWGLWRLRRALDPQAEIHAAPSLAMERRALARFLLRRGSGVRPLRVAGQGREVDKLREYLPGDSFGDIDWKATARKATPVTRVYQIERTQSVTVLVDASRLSARPSAAGGKGDTLLESHLRACLALQLACSRQGDRFGVVAFAGKVLHRAAASAGGAAQAAVTGILAKLQPSPESPDYLELAATLGAARERRGLLILLACLDDPLAAEQALEALAPLAHKHVLVAVSARDQGASPAFSRSLGPAQDLADALSAQWRYKGLQKLAQGLKAMGAHLALVDEEHLAQEAVGLYLRARERQAV